MINKIIDNLELAKGGEGSGRYPAGSGKNPKKEAVIASEVVNTKNIDSKSLEKLGTIIGKPIDKATIVSLMGHNAVYVGKSGISSTHGENEVNFTANSSEFKGKYQHLSIRATSDGLRAVSIIPSELSDRNELKNRQRKVLENLGVKNIKFSTDGGKSFWNY